MTDPEPGWTIILTRQAEQALLRLPQQVLRQFDRKIMDLTANPRPPESRKLSGQANLYRLRLDEWWLVYETDEERRVVLILEIARRRPVKRYRLEEETITGEDHDLSQFLVDHDMGQQIIQPKIRVLIVDDSPETRENLRKLLFFQADIDVVGAAANGEEAIHMAVELEPDIILMDIILPGIDGITTTECITQQVPATQVIAMSVQGEADYLRRAIMAGAKMYLVKPFSNEELIHAIHQVYGPGKSTFANFKVGQTVHILQGPFKDLLGIVSEVNVAQALVTVLIQFFGQDKLIKMDASWLEPA